MKHNFTTDWTWPDRYLIIYLAVPQECALPVTRSGNTISRHVLVIYLFFVEKSQDFLQNSQICPFASTIRNLFFSHLHFPLAIGFLLSDFYLHLFLFFLIENLHEWYFKCVFQISRRLCSIMNSQKDFCIVWLIVVRLLLLLLLSRITLAHAN